MIHQGEGVFVDSGAWIALALSRDPLHSRAREQWDALRAAGARLHTSVPVVIETFTFLDRNANKDVSLAWKDAVVKLRLLRILVCSLRDLQASWEYFGRSDLHKLSAVDATSFTIMKRARLRLAYTFDHHFAVVGFRMVG
ncbi:MAG TPA: PIN domain-containing protein [Pirellulales bacterium]|nr:PIN domain-containing protein [Pirellulales bacterium]